ncbi:MAG: hypothetical protein HY885_00565 [Deltaproteobacteria bacterium]|nr:hypothetical protein [Deltaproteobacteria bacterium]
MKQILKTLPGLLALFGLFIFFQTRPAQAAAIEIEIFYLPHPPAMAVVDKVEQVAGEFAKATINKYSFEDPKSRKMMEKYHLTDHMPVAVFINGKDSFTLDGRTVKLRNFPKGDPFVPMFAGEWDYADLRVILAGLAGAGR